MPLTKLRILTDRMTGGGTPLQPAHSGCTVRLPLFGVVAAFGLAPDTNTLDITPEIVTEAIALPALARTGSVGTFERETADPARRHPGHRPDAAQDRRRKSSACWPRTRYVQLASAFVPGKHIARHNHPGGPVADLPVRTSDVPTLTRTPMHGEGFVAEDGSELLESRVAMRSGRIRSSLLAPPTAPAYRTPSPSRLPTFSRPDLDFHEDLRRGDRFAVVYEVNYRNGEPIAAGNCWRPSSSTRADPTVPSGSRSLWP